MRASISSLAFGAIALTLSTHSAWSAPCCGGASSLPSLVTGDDRAQLSALVSEGSVIGDAPAHGVPVFRSSGDSEVMQTFRLDGAYLLMDRVQAGAGIPIIRRSKSLRSGSYSSQGLGDVGLDVAYEALPELTYSPWKPHGFVFLQTTLPTSPSVYDANDPYLIDARGRGFFSVALGVALVKSVGNWDFLLSGEGHRSFERSFHTADGSSVDLRPGYGASALAGAGWSPGGGALRIGLSLSPIYEDAIESSDMAAGASESQLVWNTSAQVGYVLRKDWSASFTYTDQTLMGPAKNVSLSRTFAVSAQKRWEL